MEITGKNNKIILVGDDSVKDLCRNRENVVFVSIDKYNDSEWLKEKANCFINYSSNNIEYEWSEYQKLFILYMVMTDLKLDKVFHINSQNVLLKNINTYPFMKKSAYCIPINPPMRMSANIYSALVSIDLCNALIKLYEGIYKTKEKDKLSLIDSKIQFHYDKEKETYVNGGVCLGTLLYLIYDQGDIEVQNLLEEQNGLVFTNSILNNEGVDSKQQYVLNNAILNIETTKDGKNMIFDIVNNKTLDTMNIYFQGNSIGMMTEQLKTIFNF
jgi:hypothetical protein